MTDLHTSPGGEPREEQPHLLVVHPVVPPAEFRHDLGHRPVPGRGPAGLHRAPGDRRAARLRVRFAEADRNNVWLVTDRGRLLAATRGLDRLEQELTDKGFVRVHRRFLVNLGRVREIEPGFKGTLFPATDTRSHETVPVARRHIPYVRQALGL